MNIDWKRKLTSRKFWMAVVGLVTQLMIAGGATESSVTQVTAVIMAAAVLITYILAEGWTDSASAGTGAADPDPEDASEE